MPEADLMAVLYEHFVGLFPRRCARCGREFASLRHYIAETKPVGVTISYDAELGDWDPDRPLGTVALANCPCGTTLGVSTDGMPLREVHRLLAWIREETTRRGISREAFLDEIRDQLRERARNDPGLATGGA